MQFNEDMLEAEDYKHDFEANAVEAHNVMQYVNYDGRY